MISIGKKAAVEVTKSITDVADTAKEATEKLIPLINDKMHKAITNSLILSEQLPKVGAGSAKEVKEGIYTLAKSAKVIGIITSGSMMHSTNLLSDHIERSTLKVFYGAIYYAASGTLKSLKYNNLILTLAICAALLLISVIFLSISLGLYILSIVSFKKIVGALILSISILVILNFCVLRYFKKGRHFMLSKRKMIRQTDPSSIVDNISLDQQNIEKLLNIKCK